MTDETDAKTERLRFTVGPVASRLLQHVHKDHYAAELDRLLEADPSPRQITAPSADAGTVSDLLILENILERQRAGFETLLMGQTANLASVLDRFDHMDREHKLTRGLIGSVLTEGDDRIAVMERLEEVFHEQRDVLSALSERIIGEQKKRKYDLQSLAEEHLQPLVPGKDIDQQEVQMAPENARGFQR